MTLSPGLRLCGAKGAEYEVGELAWISPKHEFVRARRVVDGVRHPAQLPGEAGADEGLDVLIRRPLVGDVVAGGWSPIEKEVYAIPEATWLLEPLDVLDPEPDGPGSLLVVADTHIGPIAAGPPDDAADLDRRIRVASDLLDMLEALHERSLAAGDLEPGDILVDGADRWFYAGTDQVRPADPVAGFRADLAEWAKAAVRIVGGMERLESRESSVDGQGLVLADWIRRACDGGRKCASTVEELRGGRWRLFGLLGSRRGS